MTSKPSTPSDPRRSKTQSNPHLNQILIDYTKSLLKTIKQNQKSQETNSNKSDKLLISELSIDYFQEKLNQRQQREKARIELSSLVELYQFLMNPVLTPRDKQLTDYMLRRDFEFSEESCNVLRTYFPQIVAPSDDADSKPSPEDEDQSEQSATAESGAPKLYHTNMKALHRQKSNHSSMSSNIDFSKFLSLCLLLASDAHSITSVLQNAICLFSCNDTTNTKKFPLAILKKCLDWLDGLIPDDMRDRMIYDCFMMRMGQLDTGMVTRPEMENLLTEVEEYVAQEMVRIHQETAST